MASGIETKTNVPAYHEMLWPTLQALKQMGGSGTIQEIMDRVIEHEGYTEAQQRVIHGKGPGTEIGYRLPWARTYLRIIGAVENSSRGVWTITDLGRGLSQTDMEAIPTTVRKMSRKTFIPPVEPAEEVADETDLLTEVLTENEAGTFSST
ncbi:MAG: winged helix-turn-helix domain-containing protein, partial [Chloroflexota bacterium]|nr:winged helix-turn-helix domain-containing protein [Chloroflexota bacterium]